MAIKGGISTDYKGNLTGASYMFAGLNNVIDPYNLPLDKGWVPKAENVDIDNSNSISRREGYTSVVVTTTAHSGWSNNKISFYVDGMYLKSFNGTTATTIDVVTPNLKMWYVQVNDTIFYSNGVESGYVGGNDTQKDHFSKDFKYSTQFGTHLEFYNGRVYHVHSNKLLCTDTFDVGHSDYRYEHVATFGEAITMVRRVEDGLYVGTESMTYFLRGNDIVEGGFDQEIVADYGVVSGTDVATTGEYMPDSKARGQLVLWTSTRGICSGGAGGNFNNYSIGILSVPEALQGAALLRDNNGLRQYVTTLMTTNSEYNPYPTPTFEVDILD